ncbi:Uncharacterised protein [Mycobacteroides abscessus subsp. abscessus]|nr:Uncharacterised protein [Mycobacteroides abscessus subsp. abscessus]
MQTPLDFWRGCQPLGSRSMTIPTPAHYVSVVSPEWTVPYTATVGDSGLHYQAVHDDVDILNHHRILVTLHILFRTIRSPRAAGFADW